MNATIQWYQPQTFTITENFWSLLLSTIVLQSAFARHSNFGDFWVSPRILPSTVTFWHFAFGPRSKFILYILNLLVFLRKTRFFFDVEYIYGFVWWGEGGLQAKSMTSQRYQAVTRWRICVTMATLWQQQDGGYALLFYIFNSTVID